MDQEKVKDSCLCQCLPPMYEKEDGVIKTVIMKEWGHPLKEKVNKWTKNFFFSQKKSVIVSSSYPAA